MGHVEGSHAVTNLVAGSPSGCPAQQGGAETLITAPGQTVLVSAGQAPRYIPTPTFIADAATNMTNQRGGAWTGPYIKLCALDLRDVDRWADEQVGGPIARCGTCRPPAPTHECN